jgi:hypothetical protein
MKRHRHSALLLSLLAFAALPSLGAQTGRAPFLASVPETSDLRVKYWMSFFLAPEQELQRRAPARVQNEYGTFKLSTARTGGYFYTMISAAEGPLYTRGTWILKRSSPDGRPIQAKVFLRSDPDTFLRLYPDGDRSKLDLVVYGGVLGREVPLPVPFETACASSLADIAAWSSQILDWSLFDPQPGLYRNLRSFIAETRKRLPTLRYGDDGALDAEGRPVYIATGLPQKAPAGLNCSGFASWLADGFYRPLTGKLLDPRALAARHIEARATPAAARYESELDPFFGLDWTRNIAQTLLDARYPSRPHGLTESDVRISPFALVAAGAGPDAVNGSSAYQAYPAYQLDLGYETVGLKALLYVLALREPGSLYLASISARNGAAIPGLSRHYHVAVLAPYFEETGEFRTAVFESDAETSVEAIMRRVPKDYIHLVRLRAERDYDPPPFAAGTE